MEAVSAMEVAMEATLAMDQDSPVATVLKPLDNKDGELLDLLALYFQLKPLYKLPPFQSILQPVQWLVSLQWWLHPLSLDNKDIRTSKTKDYRILDKANNSDKDSKANGPGNKDSKVNNSANKDFKASNSVQTNGPVNKGSRDNNSTKDFRDNNLTKDFKANNFPNNQSKNNSNKDRFKEEK